MRILLSTSHKYPALSKISDGLRPKQFPSGSAYATHDLIARGLAELGHNVFYLLRKGAGKPLPKGIEVVTEPINDVDILHSIWDSDEERYWKSRSWRKPWIVSCHIDPKLVGREPLSMGENWVFVSQTLANSLGYNRYVLNGIDPKEYIFSESKDDYFLFMSAMDWNTEKGLDVALRLSAKLNFKLVVAGGAKNQKNIDRTKKMCSQTGAVYVGDVRGIKKANLLAKAKGFIFPTKVNESFGLGMIESLMSGTPVICSDKGACPEIISPDVGFVCKNEEDYENAIKEISNISPRECRNKALKDYHYLNMAKNYVTEYQKEIIKNNF